MARKSTVRERPALFRRSSDDAEPLVEEIGFEDADTPPDPSDPPVLESGKTDLPKNQEEELPRDGVSEALPNKVKTSFGLSREAAIAITMLQLDAFKQTGKKPNKDEIVSQAILELAARRNVSA
jgi:hypothetical protein